MTIDPVCKMTVDPRQAAARIEYRGTTYYLCSEHCHKQFAAQPEKYQAQSPGGGHGGHTPGHGR